MGAQSRAVQVHEPAQRLGAVLYASVGGAVAGLVGIVVLTAAGVLLDLAPAAAANAVGAWAVRWLQSAAFDALKLFYADATIGGVASSLVAGAVVGAVFGALVERWTDSRPWAFGLVSGLACWALLRWGLGPALDPLLVRAFDWRALLAACLAFGSVLGYWVQVGRSAV